MNVVSVFANKTAKTMRLLVDFASSSLLTMHAYTGTHYCSVSNYSKQNFIIVWKRCLSFKVKEV